MIPRKEKFLFINFRECEKAGLKVSKSNCKETNVGSSSGVGAATEPDPGADPPPPTEIVLRAHSFAYFWSLAFLRHPAVKC